MLHMRVIKPQQKQPRALSAPGESAQHAAGSDSVCRRRLQLVANSAKMSAFWLKNKDAKKNEWFEGKRAAAHLQQ
jgi:hypothetical protein